MQCHSAAAVADAYLSPYQSGLFSVHYFATTPVTGAAMHDATAVAAGRNSVASLELLISTGQ